MVIGASTGGVEALNIVLSVLPGDLRAAIFVVQHVGEQESFLPEILSRAGSVPAVHPSGRESIRPGRISVAPRTIT